MIFFFWVAMKLIKNRNLVRLTSQNPNIKRCDHILKHKFLYLDGQYFCFDLLTLKLGLLLSFYRPSDPRKFSLLPVQQKIKLPSLYSLFHYLLQPLYCFSIFESQGYVITCCLWKYTTHGHVRQVHKCTYITDIHDISQVRSFLN